MAVAQTVVVPLDGSEFAERAVPVAAGLARHVGGGIVLVAAARGGPDPAQPYLEKVAGTVEGVPVEPLVVHDRGAVAAIRLVASEAEGRVVCMTSHGRGGLRWAVLGSVAEEVVRTSDGPVLLVGRRCAPEWRPDGGHLLVCVDGTDRSANVMVDAWPWADAFDLDVRGAIVIHPLDVDDAEHPEQLLEPIAAKLRRGEATPDVALLRSTFAAGALVDYAESLPASLIAMASHVRSGFARLALGSVSMGVVSLARCPVLVERVG